MEIQLIIDIAMDKLMSDLCLKYYLETDDGVLEYRLTKYTTIAPNYDLFGVPSNYIKITFDEFVDLLNNSNKND
jgi:hypothetical protein